MGNFVIALSVGSITKAVTADHRAGMNDHSIADGAAIQYGHIGVNGDIVADDHMVANDNSRMKPDLIPDSNLITDDHHGADGYILAAFKVFSDDSSGVYRTPWFCRRMKILHHLCKGHHEDYQPERGCGPCG